MINTLQPGTIPTGISLGTKILQFPAVSPAFSHSGFLIGLRDRMNCTWLKRGDPIAKYVVSVPKDIPIIGSLLGESVHEVIIRSPADGLLIHTTYSFASDKYDFGQNYGGILPVRMAILLPDDEPPAEDGQYMFAALGQCIWNNRQPFLKPSRYWSKEAMTETQLKQFIDEQLALTAHYVDAMPQFEAYFQEARTNLPALRPHLRHLL